MAAEESARELVTDADREAVFARLYGEPMKEGPEGLFIPPEALRVILQSFEGPLDLLLYLIRRQRFDILDIPMAELTRQYLRYVELAREHRLELAAAYLVMSATLMQIKSRMLLPRRLDPETGEEEDPRAQLAARLLLYEAIKGAATLLDDLPRFGRDFWVAGVEPPGADEPRPVELTAHDLAQAWLDVVARTRLVKSHRIQRQELNVREHMTALLRRLMNEGRMALSELWRDAPPEVFREQLAVWLLSALELAKEGDVRLEQESAYSEIWIEPAAVLPLKDEAHEAAEETQRAPESGALETDGH